MGKRVPTVFTVCGLPGSGKTTLAREIERARAGVCFSADAWVQALYGPGLAVEEFPRHRRRVWELIWQTAERLLALGVDVVLDFSFYARSEREAYRRRAQAAGARFRMFYLDAPESLLLARLAARNLEPSAQGFTISEPQFRVLAAGFEVPVVAEEPEVLWVRAEVDLALPPDFPAS